MGEKEKDTYRMERSTTSICSLLASATPDEIVASLVLLDLRKMMSLSESLSDLNWGSRRKRSCLVAQTSLTSASSWPSPPPENRIEERKFHIEAKALASLDEKNRGGARTTGSPDTPLCFSPSESDEKRQSCSKKSSNKRLLRPRDERLWLEEGTRRKELLTGEIENVKKFKKLKPYTLQLKAKKQEVLISGGLNLEVNLAQHYRINSESLFTADQTAQECKFYFLPISAHPQPSGDGVRSVNHRVPRGFDLNLPAEEAFDVELYQPLDVIADKRAGFAEARRKRIGIIKAKSRKAMC